MTEAAAATPLFRQLLETAPDAILAVDGDGRIAVVNAQTERLFGYARDELIGEPVEILVPEAARGVHAGHRDAYAAHPVARPMGAGMELAAAAGKVERMHGPYRIPTLLKRVDQLCREQTGEA